MNAFLFAVALFLFINLIVGIWRILRGPTASDLMLAAQLFGTIAVAILLLLAQAVEDASLRDVALIFALLSAIAGVAFVRRTDLKEVHDYDAD